MRPIRERCRQAYRTLIKKDEKLVEVLREEALDLVTSKFKVTRETYGPNSVAFQVLCRISNEEAYFMIKISQSWIQDE
jgi:formate dehydrogenase (coenzyme F420) alpha subunit